MDKTAYDKRKMRAFLLGALTDEETELLDELSFTDDRFAEELNASEKDLVDAYARGELEADELESFENHYLASPLRREKAEFAAAFQTFAARKITETEPAPVAAIPERRAESFFARWNIFRRPGFALQLGIAAATLLFLFLGGWLWLSNRGPDERMSETQPPPIVQTEKTENEKQLAERREPPEDNSNREKSPKESVLVAQNQPPEQPRKQPEQKKKSPEDSPPQVQPKQTPPLTAGSDEPRIEPRVGVATIILAPSLRGGDAGKIANLSISPETDFVDARLALEADEFPVYRVALVDLSNKTLWQSGALKAQKSGDGQTLTVRFPAVNLKPQVYSLVVSGIRTNAAPEQISSYSFRVVMN